MQTLQIKISKADFQKYNFGKKEIKFIDLVDLINKEYAKKALLRSNEIAKKEGLSEVTMDEIKAVRNAKAHS